MCVFLSAYLVDFMRAGDRWKGEGLVISLNHLVYTPLGTEHRGGELWLGVRGTEIRTPVATRVWRQMVDLVGGRAGAEYRGSEFESVGPVDS